MPKPLHIAIAPPDERWVRFLWIGICGLLALALFGGTRHQEIGWLAAWVAAAVCLGWGLFGRNRARRLKTALPFAPGVYVFATDVVLAEDGRCLLHPFDTLTSVRLRPVTGTGGVQEAQIEWHFPGETVSLQMPSQQIAQRLLGQIQTVRDRLAVVMAEENWGNLSALDPLYEARYGGAWEQVCAPVVLQGARNETGWFGLHAAALRNGAFAGLVAGAVLWFGSNLARDGVAFRIAESKNTETAWRQFLKRPDSSYHNQVKRRNLPEAALRAAKSDGGAEALRRVANEYGNTPAGEEAKADLARIYGAAESKSIGEVDPQARAAMQSLLRWLRENGSADLDVRFGESSEVWLGSVDSFFQQALPPSQNILKIEPVAASFSPAAVHRREDAIVSVLRQGFENFASSDVINIQKGRPFSGEPVRFEKPAIAVQIDVKPLLAPIIDETGRVYLMLDFSFKVALTTPGAPNYEFTLPFSPAEFLGGTDSGSIYDRMANIAYQELHQKLGESFFPRHVPARAIKLTQTLRPPRAASPRPAFSSHPMATSSRPSTSPTAQKIFGSSRRPARCLPDSSARIRKTTSRC